MPEPAIRANETTVPMLPCVSPEDTLQFYRALGFELAIAMDEPDEVASRLAELDAIELTATDRAQVESELGHAAALRQWLDGGTATST